MSKYEFYPNNIAYIDCAAGVRRIQEKLGVVEPDVMGLLQSTRWDIMQTGNVADPTGAKTLSAVINPRDRSTEEPIYDKYAASRATDMGLVLGWAICQEEARQQALAPYDLVTQAVKQPGREGSDDAETLALAAEDLVNLGGMGIALLGQSVEEVDDWIDAIESDIRLQTLTKTGLGLMVYQANKAVGAADLKRMRRDAEKTNWESLAKEIDAWRQADDNNS